MKEGILRFVFAWIKERVERQFDIANSRKKEAFSFTAGWKDLEVFQLYWTFLLNENMPGSKGNGMEMGLEKMLAKKC